MAKRKERQAEYKRKISEEIATMLREKEGDSKEIDFDARGWEKEFDSKNSTPDLNSDYDSDSEVDPAQRLYMPPVPGKKKKVSAENPMKRRRIQLSFVGKQNAGKSTLVNSLLKDHRVIASDIPGTTRDAVSIEWEYKKRRITLVDTAGMKPRVKLTTTLERMVQRDVERAIDMSHIVAVTIDARNSVRPQDLAIIRQVFNEGRGLIIVVNKWDLIPEKMQARVRKRIEKIQTSKGGVSLQSAIVTYSSALTGFNVNSVMNGVLKAYEMWNTRVSTSLLNKWLEELKRVHKMPAYKGKTLRLRYIMQIAVRPPTFYLYVNDTKLCTEEFERFVTNALGTEYKLRGVPIRLIIRDRTGYAIRAGTGKESEATRKVQERIKAYKAMLRRPTKMRRIIGSRKLYRQKPGSGFKRRGMGKSSNGDTKEKDKVKEQPQEQQH